LQEGESLENALRRFKRKVQTEDIIKDVKGHYFYLKPGERRRVKQAFGAAACSEKDSQRWESSSAKENRYWEVAPNTFRWVNLLTKSSAVNSMSPRLQPDRCGSG
jgi:small subunit ribosomal protein S21